MLANICASLFDSRLPVTLSYFWIPNLSLTRWHAHTHTVCGSLPRILREVFLRVLCTTTPCHFTRFLLAELLNNTPFHPTSRSTQPARNGNKPIQRLRGIFWECDSEHDSAVYFVLLLGKIHQSTAWQWPDQHHRTDLSQCHIKTVYGLFRF